MMNHSTTNSDKDNKVEELLKIIRGAEKLDNLTKRLEDFNRDTREIYKDKHL